MNVNVSWTLSGVDSADFYLININTNAPQTPYEGLLNITTCSNTQQELTGFMVGYEYNITVRGICGGQEGSESEPLTVTPQGMCLQVKLYIYIYLYTPYNMRVVFSKPVYAVRARGGLPSPNHGLFAAKPSSHHVQVTLG